MFLHLLLLGSICNTTFSQRKRYADLCDVQDVMSPGVFPVAISPIEKWASEGRPRIRDVTVTLKGDEKCEVALSDGTFYRCILETKSWVQIPKMEDNEDTHVFRLMLTPQSPPDAFRSCRALGGNAATVYTDKINFLMARMMWMADVYVATIGYSDNDEEGIWRWQSNSFEHNSTDTPNPRFAEEVKSDENYVKHIFVPKLPDKPDSILFKAFTAWHGSQPNNYYPGENYAALLAVRSTFAVWFDIGPPALTSPIVRDATNRKEVADPLLLPYWCELPTDNLQFVGTARLVGGGEQNSGLLVVEVEPGEWCAVCWDTWSSVKAKAACRTITGDLEFEGDASYMDTTNTYNHADGYRFAAKFNADYCSAADSLFSCDYTVRHHPCRLAVVLTCEEIPDVVLPDCDVGTYLDGNFCRKCGYGEYQDETKQITCKSCGEVMTTGQEGSTSKEDCFMDRLYNPQCGIRMFDAGYENTARIIGGVDAMKKEFPWQVMVNWSGSAVCGGTILSPTTIITAAHCVQQQWHNKEICYATNSLSALQRIVDEDGINIGGLEIKKSVASKCVWQEAETLSVTAGITKRDSLEFEQKRDVAEVFVSERYTRVYGGGLHNDIAVLKLAQPLDFGLGILGVVKLAASNYNNYFIYCESDNRAKIGVSDERNTWRIITDSDGEGMLVNREGMYLTKYPYDELVYCSDKKEHVLKFIKVPAINGKEDAISFKISGSYGMHVRHQGYYLKVHSYSNLPLYLADSSFDVLTDKEDGHVLPACLPVSARDYKLHSTSSDPLLTITGFGVERFDGPQFLAKVLQKGYIPSIDINNCNASMDGLISRNMFCAGDHDGKIDTCTGDSGGPIGLDELGTGEVSYIGEKKYSVLGVTSWGKACGKAGNYGVYTDLSKFLDFIWHAANGHIAPVVQRDNFADILHTAVPVGYSAGPYSAGHGYAGHGYGLGYGTGYGTGYGHYYG